jgi:hypothetical protein
MQEVGATAVWRPWWGPLTGEGAEFRSPNLPPVVGAEADVETEQRRLAAEAIEVAAGRVLGVEQGGTLEITSLGPIPEGARVELIASSVRAPPLAFPITEHSMRMSVFDKAADADAGAAYAWGPHGQGGGDLLIDGPIALTTEFVKAGRFDYVEFWPDATTPGTTTFATLKFNAKADIAEGGFIRLQLPPGWTMPMFDTAAALENYTNFRAAEEQGRKERATAEGLRLRSASWLEWRNTAVDDEGTLFKYFPPAPSLWDQAQMHWRPGGPGASAGPPLFTAAPYGEYSNASSAILDVKMLSHAHINIAARWVPFHAPPELNSTRAGFRTFDLTRVRPNEPYRPYISGFYPGESRDGVLVVGPNCTVAVDPVWPWTLPLPGEHPPGELFFQLDPLCGNLYPGRCHIPNTDEVTIRIGPVRTPPSARPATTSAVLLASLAPWGRRIDGWQGAEVPAVEAGQLVGNLTFEAIRVKATEPNRASWQSAVEAEEVLPSFDDSIVSPVAVGSSATATLDFMAPHGVPAGGSIAVELPVGWSIVESKGFPFDAVATEGDDFPIGVGAGVGLSFEHPVGLRVDNANGTIAKGQWVDCPSNYETGSGRVPLHQLGGGDNDFIGKFDATLPDGQYFWSTERLARQASTSSPALAAAAANRLPSERVDRAHAALYCSDDDAAFVDYGGKKPPRTLVVTLADGGPTSVQGIPEGARVKITFSKQILVPPSVSADYPGVAVGTMAMKQTSDGSWAALANITTRSHTPPFLHRSVGPSSYTAAKLTVDQLAEVNWWNQYKYDRLNVWQKLRATPFPTPSAAASFAITSAETAMVTAYTPSFSPISAAWPPMVGDTFAGPNQGASSYAPAALVTEGARLQLGQGMEGEDSDSFFSDEDFMDDDSDGFLHGWGQKFEYGRYLAEGQGFRDEALDLVDTWEGEYRLDTNSIIDGPTSAVVSQVTSGEFYGELLSWDTLDDIPGYLTDATLHVRPSGAMLPGSKISIDLPVGWSIGSFRATGVQYDSIVPLEVWVMSSKPYSVGNASVNYPAVSDGDAYFQANPNVASFELPACKAQFEQKVLGQDEGGMLTIWLQRMVVPEEHDLMIKLTNVWTPPSTRGRKVATVTSVQYDGGVIDGPTDILTDVLTTGALNEASWDTPLASTGQFGTVFFSFITTGALPAGSLIEIKLSLEGAPWLMGDSPSVSFVKPASVGATASYDRPTRTLKVWTSQEQAAHNDFVYVQVEEVTTPGVMMNMSIATVSTYHSEYDTTAPDESRIHGPSPMNVTAIGWVTYDPPVLLYIQFTDSAVWIMVYFDRETDRGRRRLTCGSDEANAILANPGRYKDHSSFNGAMTDDMPCPTLEADFDCNEIIYFPQLPNHAPMKCTWQNPPSQLRVTLDYRATVLPENTIQIRDDALKYDCEMCESPFSTQDAEGS